MKGRALSIEAIQAVQYLKRAHRSNPADLSSVERTLSRLIKSDLVAVLWELLRRGAPGDPDSLSLYADVGRAQARGGEEDSIDELVAVLERAAVVSTAGIGREWGGS